MFHDDDQIVGEYVMPSVQLYIKVQKKKIEKKKSRKIQTLSVPTTLN